MARTSRVATLLGALLLAAGRAAGAATTYYVAAPGGSDSNPGTLALPWRTIQKAAATLQAGDTVLIRAGTYAERVIPQNSGAAGQYISYAAYPGETPILDGTGLTVPDDEGLFHMVGRQYLRVSGLRIVHSAFAGIYADLAGHLLIQNNSTYDTASSGIGIWGSLDVTIEGNRVEESNAGGWQECITVAGTDTFTVRDNEVVRCHKEGICLKDGSAHGQVYRNHTYQTDDPGLYVDAWDKHTQDIALFGNLVHGVVSAKAGIAISSEQGGLLENVRVYNNVVYGNGYAGLQVTECCIATHPMRDLLIVNNTLYGNGVVWGGGIAVDNPQAQGVVVRNNIVSANLSFQIIVASSVPPSQVTIDHNLIHGFRGAEDETRGTAYVEGDPRFVNPSAANFRLTATSPAVNAGATTSAPTADYDGNVRDGQPDIGAHEYGATFCTGAATGDSDLDGIPDAVEGVEGKNPCRKDNDVFTSARLFAMQQYRDFLKREGESTGISYWTSSIAGGTPRASVTKQFFDSPEFQGAIAPVARLYFAYFNRIPDLGGLEYWLANYRAGMSLNAISEAFAGSPEFQATYGSLNTSQFVTLVYQNVLGRAPDAGGLAYWTWRLDSGAETRGQVMVGFSESAEYRQTSYARVFVTMVYYGMLRRVPEQGGFDYWVWQISLGSSSLDLINGFLGAPEYRGRFLP